MHVTTEQENALVAKAKERDSAALEALFKRYRPLMIQMAGRYREYVGFEDQMSHAAIGLMKAIDDFKPETATFITFAHWKIRGECWHAQREARLARSSLNRYGNPKAIEFGGEEAALLMEAKADDTDLIDQLSLTFTLDAIKKKLTDHQFRVVMLIAEGFSKVEVAEMLNVTDSAIHEIGYRIRHKLQNSCVAA